MKITHTTMFIAVLGAGMVWGQNRPTLPTVGSSAAATPNVITVNASDLGCSKSGSNDSFEVSSWSWGGTSAPQTAPNLQNVSVSKKFDACSPAIADAGATGKSLGTVTITEKDSEGNVLVKVTMKDALITAYGITGNESMASPGESVSFGFVQIQIAPATGNPICYDAQTVKTGCSL